MQLRLLASRTQRMKRMQTFWIWLAFAIVVTSALMAFTTSWWYLLGIVIALALIRTTVHQ